MVYWQPIDVEDCLRDDLRRMIPDLSVSAPPLARNLTSLLPHVLLTRVGGSRVNIVVDAHRVSVDVYAVSWSEATRVADRVCGGIAQLADDPQRAHDWKRVNVLTLPYANPDPDHPTIPRMSMLVELFHRISVTN